MNIPFQSATTDDILKKEIDVTGASIRNTLSPKNASEFRALFDDMIKTRENRQVLSSTTGLKSSTLYQKCNDALKFLAENGSATSPYRTLRQDISIKRRSDRIVLYFKQSIRHVVEMQGIISTQADELWKSQFTTWLGSAKVGDLYDSREVHPTLVLGDEDRKWLTQLLSGVDGAELDLQPAYFRVAR